VPYVVQRMLLYKMTSFFVMELVTEGSTRTV
jgi:hypothetical protein